MNVLHWTLRLWRPVGGVAKVAGGGECGGKCGGECGVGRRVVWAVPSSCCGHVATTELTALFVKVSMPAPCLDFGIWNLESAPAGLSRFDLKMRSIDLK